MELVKANLGLVLKSRSKLSLAQVRVIAKIVRNETDMAGGPENWLTMEFSPKTTR